ncbi:MAG TPA: hypothetical protein VGP99_06680 [Tepidisphaeraceae bacterium]|jgi:hypothetical protein|nr:hypothetical protein [Tepidisphaeraceae bacterium]
MSLGLTIFTIVHVIISLIGVFSGFVVLAGLLSARRFDGWTAIFLTSTVLTSVTGFFFPVHHFMPSHGVGILSLLLLPVAIYARYGRNLIGHWRWTYVLTAMLAFYFNVFVLVVQLFVKVPALKTIAPTQSEPPFGITQLSVLLVFVAFTIAAARRFRNLPAALPILQPAATSA